MSNMHRNHAMAIAGSTGGSHPPTGRSAKVIALARKAGARDSVSGLAPRGDDRALAGAARAALVKHLGAVGATIAFNLRDGVADLHGWVESGNQKRIAEDALRDLDGLRGVRNHLRVQPPSKLARRTPRR